MTRDEYGQQCKKRALQYLDRGEIANAVTSMMSDMDKREDTRVGPVLTTLGLMAAMSKDISSARRFIVGFN